MKKNKPKSRKVKQFISIVIIKEFDAIREQLRKRKVKYKEALFSAGHEIRFETGPRFFIFNRSELTKLPRWKGRPFLPNSNRHGFPIYAFRGKLWPIVQMI